MISRRGFLGAILAAGMAPAIVKASSLMPIIARVEPVIRKGGSVRWVPLSEQTTEIVDWLAEAQRRVHAALLINPPLIQDPFTGRITPFVPVCPDWFTLKLKP